MSEAKLSAAAKGKQRQARLNRLVRSVLAEDARNGGVEGRAYLIRCAQGFSEADKEAVMDAIAEMDQDASVPPGVTIQ